MQLKCKKHPKYQAKRRPTAECDHCKAMWSVVVLDRAIKELRKLP